jgi:carbon monoxide dehydrogenase subunit G
MDMTGERRIPAPRQIVWEALNNPEVLKASIPGCETLEKLSDTQMKATAGVKLGPISARFTGNVLLSEIDPPNSYRISGEGQGGVAGFAKGGAAVKLTDDAADTLLSYQVNAQVGGKLAQLGARLIDASAKQMADAFFDRFSQQVQAMSPPIETVHPGTLVAEPAGGAIMAEPVMATMSSVSAPSAVPIWALIPREPFGLPLAAWVGGGVFVVMVLLMLGSMI